MARVLLVDNDPDIREATGWRLRLDGHDVVEAPDADSAVALASAEPPRFDLAVLDLHAPASVILRARSVLREHDCTRYLPVVYYTAGQVDPAADAVRTGADACLGSGQPVTRLLAAIDVLTQRAA
jgi:CheY-like chemotaxis protein